MIATSVTCTWTMRSFKCAKYEFRSRATHIHGDAVIAVDRAAINKQVSTSMGPDMAEGYPLERLALLAGH
jgi:hypothetical protein